MMKRPGSPLENAESLKYTQQQELKLQIQKQQLKQQELLGHTNRRGNEERNEDYPTPPSSQSSEVRYPVTTQRRYQTTRPLSISTDASYDYDRTYHTYTLRAFHSNIKERADDEETGLFYIDLFTQAHNQLAPAALQAFLESQGSSMPHYVLRNLMVYFRQEYLKNVDTKEEDFFARFYRVIVNYIQERADHSD